MIKYLVDENILHRSKVDKKIINHITEFRNAHIFLPLKAKYGEHFWVLQQMFCTITLS